MDELIQGWDRANRFEHRIHHAEKLQVLPPDAECKCPSMAVSGEAGALNNSATG
jgi:hypothetical protein